MSKNLFGGPERMPYHVDILNILCRNLEIGQTSINMTLFKDDDGKAYQLY